MRPAKYILFFVVCILLSSQSLAQSAVFIGLGDATGGDPYTDFEGGALGISPDGNIVVGYVESVNGIEAFRWVRNICDLSIVRPADCTETLGDLPGDIFFSRAFDVSNTGVVVGQSRSSHGYQAFKWDNVGGMVGLLTEEDNDYTHAAQAITSDGETIVGRDGFIWTEMEGTQQLYLGGTRTYINGIAENKETIAGTIQRNSDSDDGFIRFFETQPYQTIGFLDQSITTPNTHITSLSGNGKVVVGSSAVLDGGNYRTHPFRWEYNGQCDLASDPSSCMTDLGVLNYASGYATAVSGNGQYVVGVLQTTGYYTNPTAFLWFELDQEMRILKDVLQDDFGVDLSDWKLQWARAISDDGRVIAGEGERIGSGKKEAWVVYLPPTLEAPYRNVDKLTLQDLGYICTQGVLGTTSHGAFSQLYYSLDFAFSGQGSQDEIIVAAASGRAYVHDCDVNQFSDCDSNFGNHVNIDHGVEFPDGDKLFSLYAHLKSFAIGLHDTDVKRGQYIGIEGNTGAVVGNPGDHIHFGLMKGDPTQDAWMAVSVPTGRFFVRDVTTGNSDKIISDDEFVCDVDENGSNPNGGHAYDDTHLAGNISACSNGLDDDYDLMQDTGIDYAGIDIDKDGIAEIPADPSCAGPNDNCEKDSCSRCGIGFELVFVLTPLYLFYSRRKKFLR